MMRRNVELNRMTPRPLAAGSRGYTSDPVPENETPKKKRKEKTDRNLSSTSSLLLPENGSENTSHCTTIAISICFAVSIAAINSAYEPHHQPHEQAEQKAQ